jgi:hypothetical protein
MSTQLVLRDTVAGDIPAVFKNLRKEDRREFAVFGMGDRPEEVAALIVMTTKRCFTVLSPKGHPLVIFGVSTQTGDPSVGVIFAIASTRAVPYRRFFVRHTERFLSLLSPGYLVLSNWKDARNTTHIRWLQRLGFVFIRREASFNGSGFPFINFVRPTT